MDISANRHWIRGRPLVGLSFSLASPPRRSVARLGLERNAARPSGADRALGLLNSSYFSMWAVTGGMTPCRPIVAASSGGGEAKAA